MEFAGDGDDAACLQLRDTFSIYSEITFIACKKGKGPTADKLAQSVLPNWISFSRNAGYTPNG